MTQQHPEVDGPSSSDDPALAASAKSGVPLPLPPSPHSDGTAASAGRERDPADARPHFTTKTGAGETPQDVPPPAD